MQCFQNVPTRPDMNSWNPTISELIPKMILDGFRCLLVSSFLIKTQHFKFFGKEVGVRLFMTEQWLLTAGNSNFPNTFISDHALSPKPWEWSCTHFFWILLRSHHTAKLLIDSVCNIPMGLWLFFFLAWLMSMWWEGEPQSYILWGILSVSWW